jgi:phosphatidylglycerol---prolipoprotein diacylglyceryl transferase
VPTFALAFPSIDPVLIEIGPFAIRWYALAYIVGLVAGWRYVRWLVQRPGWRLTPLEIDDLLLYVTLGVVLGGRLGYVLFYRPGYYLSQPL